MCWLFLDKQAEDHRKFLYLKHENKSFEDKVLNHNRKKTFSWKMGWSAAIQAQELK